MKHSAPSYWKKAIEKTDTIPHPTFLCPTEQQKTRSAGQSNRRSVIPLTPDVVPMNILAPLRPPFFQDQDLETTEQKPASNAQSITSHEWQSRSLHGITFSKGSRSDGFEDSQPFLYSDVVRGRRVLLKIPDEANKSDERHAGTPNRSDDHDAANAPEQSRSHETIPRNRGGHRIDHFKPCDRQKYQKLQEKRYCNNYYLLCLCLFRERCRLVHGLLSEEYKLSLRALAGSRPRANGGSCSVERCYAGHHCPFRLRPGEHLCHFQAHMHISDREVAAYTPATENIRLTKDGLHKKM